MNRGTGEEELEPMTPPKTGSQHDSERRLHIRYAAGGLEGKLPGNRTVEIVDLSTAGLAIATSERLLLDKPRVALRFLEFTGLRLQEAERRLEEIAFKSIPARLASLLLRLKTEQASNTINGYTHQSLGEMLGTYRETTTQTLNEFKGRGLLEIGRKRIDILDQEGLSLIADG